MPAAPALSTPHHRWLIASLIVVVSLMVGGGLITRELYRRPERPPAVVVASPSGTTLPPTEQPGSPVVQLTPDAAAHPQHEDVRALLQQYFDSINSINYEAWKNTVTRARVQAKPRSVWESDYRSTKDGSILVYRIDSLPKGNLRVSLAFTSIQDPSAAPKELRASCLRWKLVLPLTLEGGHLRVDAAVTGSPAPEMSRC
ncbi:hypothetical protein [Amycolatopsis taiwanensis]|uniref:hypothetical protein n=1 Tax=Amycolatopsis taiwanensis TaxID=342230 RepID=UPI000694923E|nr:hypothetical protein [Amycolatopsis taiwanensis]